MKHYDWVPCNNYIIVERIEESEDNKTQGSTFEIPLELQDDKEKMWGTSIVRILDTDEDFKENDYLVGKIAAVETNLIEEFEFQRKKINIIKANYVKAVLVKYSGSSKHSQENKYNG